MRIAYDFLSEPRFSEDIYGTLDKFDVLAAPVKIYGVFNSGGKFRRLPENVANSVSHGVGVWHSAPTGGRIRFRTNSKRIALFVDEKPFWVKSESFFASSGFEIVADGRYAATVYPKDESEEKFCGNAKFETGKMRDITVYMPLHSVDVRSVFIGLEKGCKLEPPAPYRIEKPIVYYGSSITQGNCASKPSTHYEAFIERWLDADYLDLGFAGNAKGEKNMIDYIASLDMSAFVLDYDYNADTAEQLRATHSNCYETVRRAHPDIPIIMASMPVARKTENSNKRLDVIKETYAYAVGRGDRKVAVIDGRELLGGADAEWCLVDGCHPTDLGFYRMAKRIYKEMLKFEELKK